MLRRLGASHGGTLGTALLVHGEPEACAGLAGALEGVGLSRQGIAVHTADQRFDLEYRDGRWVATVGAAAESRLAADVASASRDWHNDYAQTLLDLRTALNKASDDGSRRHLLQELRRLISAGER